MIAIVQHQLGEWEVRIDPDGIGPAWLSPDEARGLAAQLLAAADETTRRRALDAASSLRQRILKQLSCCPYHVPGGLAKLLGEDTSAVEAELQQLLTEGAVVLCRGMGGFYALAGGER